MANDRDVEEVLRAEQDLYRAMVARDRTALLEMLAPDVVYVHSTAVAESRDEYLAGVAAGLYEYESVSSRGVRVRIHGETAFVDGICDMRVGAKEVLRRSSTCCSCSRGCVAGARGAWCIGTRSHSRLRKWKPNSSRKQPRSSCKRGAAESCSMPARCCRPVTLEESHAIQVAAAERLGETIAGWKVAATPEGRVVRGGLLRSRVVRSGATLSSSLVPLLGVEAEIAFRFERALPARAPRTATRKSRTRRWRCPPSRSSIPVFATIPAHLCSTGSPTACPTARSSRGTPAAMAKVDLVPNPDVELTIDGIHRAAIGGHLTKDPLLPAVALVNDLRARDRAGAS